MIIVAIGANLPGRAGASALRTCSEAAEALSGIPGLRLMNISRWYATAPIPVSDQPDYINGAARLEGAIEPASLLERLNLIEARAGRARGAANAPRTLDLDIIAMGDLTREHPDPVLPHPRAHERAFVLAPLRDVAPEWRHPLLGKTAEEMLAALPPQRIRRL